MSATQGSTGNVIAAICSLFVPGLGQLVQGRLLSAIFWFVAACVLLVVVFVFSLTLLGGAGWTIAAILSCISAATYDRS
jgi:TM2 domain-containing membrane protein YozV